MAKYTCLDTDENLDGLCAMSLDLDKLVLALPCKSEGKS
eukprot:CAMPEP_0170467270 /NCGR_PEP_ID=MMETSP0123-20130129/10909_1 /TAXON_ID=182087 /ORGANISM="Favella ehrenbergii, Strain Fehren 1" /LENGTH=38 /DNA_ID= /DNA_START= /DNA_END= /DNA_ORIENTATION=